MNATTQSTLQLSKRLIAKGFSYEQAEVLAEIFREHRTEAIPIAEINDFATKADLAELGAVTKDELASFGRHITMHLYIAVTLCTAATVTLLKVL